MAAQLIRRSQFITTYGPGAIIEGPEGPRVIRSLDQAGIFNTHQPARFEITDRRLSVSLLQGARILRIPSNAELGRPEAERVYSTNPFPGWSLCVTHNILYRKRTSDNVGCPRCAPHSDSNAAWRQAQSEAIRFVTACEAGHLDDVDWVGVTHATATPGCSPPFLNWNGGGGALRNVDISCPVCGAQINLGLAYSRDWRCSGREPERGTARPGGCARPAKIIQRGAANLRLADLQSALTIPPTTTRLHRLLEMSGIAAVLTIIQPTRVALLQAVSALVGNNQVPATVLSELANFSDATISAAIADTLAAGAATTPRTLRLQELTALRNAATFGAPPLASGTPGSPDQFEVVLQEVRRIQLASGRVLRVTPVNRLRVVMVQTGYRRMSPTGTPIDIAYHDGAQRWYPGVELFGEGLFIDMDPGETPGPPRHYPLVGRSAAAWMQEWSASTGLDPLERDRRHPVAVWWHVFAHRLITALSIDSGYSSASIRERVLVDVDDASGRAGGGILLYTVQPGGDGTLGGLVALVPQFERVLAAAFRNIDSCSNDPLCGEEPFAQGKYNGAACYSCALISETSCEARNLWLDRNVLLENLP